jgi:hypothetical protein
MCRKLICSISFVLALGLLLPSAAKAADPDLVGWWKLDEGSGATAFDSSRSGTNGTIANAITGGMGPGGSAWVNDPDHGMVLSFNGNDSSGTYVSMGNIIPAMTLTNGFTWAFWAKQEGDGTGVNQVVLGNRYGGTASPLQFIKFTPTRFEYYNTDHNGTIDYADLPAGQWVHLAVVKDAANLTHYRNAQPAGTSTTTATIDPNPFFIGGDATAEHWSGWISDARIYTKALTPAEVLGAMQGLGEAWPYASSPSPADGAYNKDTWLTLSWKPGGRAVSHDVYLGDSFDDVNAGMGDTFRGNQGATSLLVGFAGNPYPDGLVPGTTYYWRIDEVNAAEPNSPWKGPVWSFSIPPRTAYNPNPADGAEFVALNTKLTWAAGYGAKLHTIYLGGNFDDVNNATSGGAMVGTTTYSPASLKSGQVYYWRVDEMNPPNTYKGPVWSFTTPGAVGKPHPTNGVSDAEMNAILSWTRSASAASHQVYFGTDKEAVRKANATSPEYKGTRALGVESYDPGLLPWDSTYYWRVDEVDNANSPAKGPLWSFTTGSYLLVEDFESYNDVDPPGAGSNRIFDKWIDGFGTTTNGAVVGNALPPYAERTIVHGGAQSMPYAYDTNLKSSEATLTLVPARDWTAQGVTSLSLWFRGASTNGAERMYVALNGTAVVYNTETSLTQKGAWTQWVIPLQQFADLGVNLTNVTSISIGFGTKGNTTTAGSTGKMYFDDLRLYR